MKNPKLRRQRLNRNRTQQRARHNQRPIPRLHPPAWYGFGIVPASFALFRFQLVGKGWHTFLLFILGGSWGLQFTLLKIATDAELVELGILTVSMALLAATYPLAMAFCRAWFRPTQQHVRFFILSGLFGFVVPP